MRDWLWLRPPQDPQVQQKENNGEKLEFRRLFRKNAQSQFWGGYFWYWLESSNHQAYPTQNVARQLAFSRVRRVGGGFQSVHALIESEWRIPTDAAAIFLLRFLAVNCKKSVCVYGNALRLWRQRLQLEEYLSNQLGSFSPGGLQFRSHALGCWCRQCRRCCYKT